MIPLQLGTMFLVSIFKVFIWYLTYDDINSQINNYYIHFDPINENVLAKKKLIDKISSGPDNIQSLIVKDCAEELTCSHKIVYV